MIQSMTAFARHSFQESFGDATWEIKVVNHRYFDCVIKLPEFFKPLEAELRLKLQQQLHRGRIEALLRFNHSSSKAPNLALNTLLVKKLVTLVKEVKSYLPMAAVDPMRILAWPEVLQTSDPDLEPAQKMVVELFEKSLKELLISRKREGAAIATLIKNQLQTIFTLVANIKEKIPETTNNSKLKLKSRLAEITSNLDQSRLEQELVYLTQKMDITEESDRLVIHATEIARVLEQEELAGKRLDFLIQELNREANTLAAKSATAEITQIAVELKVLIEQLREQVQNVL